MLAKEGQLKRIGQQGLTKDQVQTVNAAAENMTKSQKNLVDTRNKKIPHIRGNSSSSREEGPSRRKGKGIDPTEWGNINISLESLDVDAQTAAWKSLANKNVANPKPSTRVGRIPYSRDHRSSSRLPAESRPVAQLPKDSYLGKTLRNIEKPTNNNRARYGDDRSPSPSDPSSSGEEQSDSESSESSRERSRRRRNNHHGRNKRRRRRSSSTSSKLVIKPIAPIKYNGSADARLYHRFVRESEAYLKDGKVKGRRRIFLLSHYLTDKAYDFYTQKVANNEADWTLSHFYDELFNFCFPIDYRMQIRRNLNHCHQNNKTVTEYVHELTELFNMIGDNSERDQVLKFWNGSRAIIQKGLWRDNLNPEVSSWSSVIAQAEIIEISENVADRRDRRAGLAGQSSQTFTHGGGSSSRSKSKTTDRSVRSVSFDQRSTTHSKASSHQNSVNSDHRSSSSRGREGSRSFRGRTGYRGNSRTSNSSGADTRSTPRITDKEKADRLAAGQCFVCGGSDHFSRDCPTKKMVKSSGGKPPGTSSFNIEPPISESEIDVSVEVLDSLPVGAIAFEPMNIYSETIPKEPSEQELEDIPSWPISEWQDHYPFWKQPDILANRSMGYSYIVVANTILTKGQPYPGDDLSTAPTRRPEYRFRIQERQLCYEVYDTFVGRQVSLPKHLVKQPCFNLSRWYAVKRTKLLSLDRSEALPYVGLMGHAICEVAQTHLANGVHTYYPSKRMDLNPRNRFVVCPRNLVKNKYIVTDKDAKIHVEISGANLEDASFDIVGWYINVLKEQNLYPSGARVRLEGSCCRNDHVFVGCSSLEKASPTMESSNENVDDYTHNDLPDLLRVPDEGEEEFDDLPDLLPLSDDEDSDDENEDDGFVSDDDVGEEEEDEPLRVEDLPEEILVVRLAEVLTSCQPFPGDGLAVDPTYVQDESRFIFQRHRPTSLNIVEIYDRVQGFETHISLDVLRDESFRPGVWFAERCAYNQNLPQPWREAQTWAESRSGTSVTMWAFEPEEEMEFFTREMTEAEALELGGVQVDCNRYPSLQRNSANIKSNSRILPKPVVVRVEVNGHPVRALLDSGSLGDFISSTLVDQLAVKRETLDTPLSLHLAVQGLRSKVNARATVQLKYQGVNEPRTLDIINLNNYDLILGTPFMYQHQICLGFNPARVVVGSDDPLPLKAGLDTKLMVSMLDTLEEKEIEAAREKLRQYADPICKEVNETDLPPFRAINHTIPLIDESKIYPWRPSRCPEVFRSQWAEKRDAYLKSGGWEVTASGNTVPMLLIPKLNVKPPVLRTVVDLRERNKNTHRMTSPLPDMEGVLRRTAKHKFRTMLDMKNAYEQIRVVPEHVSRTTVTTPDGNMVSKVIQIGDCNAPATYQALMNHLFSAYIGRFLDIYLDDIVIYSDSLDDHEKHVKIVLDILKREKLYLSRQKLHFIQPELKLLGRIIDDEGIRMDPHKVDSVLSWKVPTNRDLLRGFIGSVGYLADDIPNVRLPLGVLSAITGDTVPFRWGYTEQRAFDEVKSLVQAARNHS